MMQFGLFEIAQQVEDKSPSQIYGDLLDQMVLAEELGFDAVFFAKHHFHSGYGTCPSPPVFLAAMAQRTKRLRLGVAVSLLPLHKIP